MIGIINYGTGNIGSIYNMLRKIGAEVEICSNFDEVNKCKKIIIPGVGSYDNAIEKLESSGLFECIKEKAVEGTPILGICLGMQLLGTTSQEGKLRGLNLIPGHVMHFPDDIGLRVPHMGWNMVDFTEEEMGKNLLKNNKFYFVHRYFFVPQSKSYIAGFTEYGLKFSSFIKKDNIYGVQFHPEKSHKYGMLLLKNFNDMK